MPPCRHCGARVEPWRAWPGRFSAAAGYLCAGQRRLRALTLIGQEIDHNVVHYRRVGFDAEHSIVQLDLTDLLTSHIHNLDIRHFVSSFPYAFTLSAMTTSPLFGPGIAPRIAIRLCSASILATVRFCTVTRSAPR